MPNTRRSAVTAVRVLHALMALLLASTSTVQSAVWTCRNGAPCPASCPTVLRDSARGMPVAAQPMRADHACCAPKHADAPSLGSSVVRSESTCLLLVRGQEERAQPVSPRPEAPEGCVPRWQDDALFVSAKVEHHYSEGPSRAQGALRSPPTPRGPPLPR